MVFSPVHTVLIRDIDSDDIKNVDLTKVHNLSGPIAVEGAEPGDCLVVDILDVAPFEKMPWGYTVRASRGLYCQSG